MLNLTVEKPAPTSEISVEEFRQHLDLAQSFPISASEPSELAISSPTTSTLGLRSLMSRFLAKEFRMRLRKLAPWLVSGVVLGLNLVLHAPLFVLGATIASLTIRIVKGILKSTPLCQRIWASLLKKSGIPEHRLPELTVCFASGAWLSAMAPTQALFFNNAEQYVTRIFNVQGVTNGVNTFLPLIFGTLRVLFCIYIGIALIRVINAFRNDEDWSIAARTPLVVILCVVLGDALTTLITGN